MAQPTYAPTSKDQYGNTTCPAGYRKVAGNPDYCTLDSTSSIASSSINSANSALNVSVTFNGVSSIVQVFAPNKNIASINAARQTNPTSPQTVRINSINSFNACAAPGPTVVTNTRSVSGLYGHGNVTNLSNIH